jgi:peptide chain release factor 1
VKQRERLLSHRDQLEARLGELDQKLMDPEVLGKPSELRKLGKERSDVDTLVRKLREYQGACERIDEAETLLATETDEELRALAKADVDTYEPRVEALEKEISDILFPADPNDAKDVIMEIRAGTGGDEAALFASELYRMYTRYAERQGWDIEVLSSNETGIGGLKEGIVSLSGRGVYGRMKFESGVHRVQRVPETEASGRIHTSAATVAVLPEAEDVDVEIKEKDIRVDVYRSSGPGGQGVNTTDSAVRITHAPSGLVVTCQDERSQIKNKAKALKILRSRLLDLKIREQEEAMRATRRSQVSTGDRSAKIRTYNFPQSRVTDHRINFSLHRLQEILDGDLDELVDALVTAASEERMEEVESGGGQGQGPAAPQR